MSEWPVAWGWRAEHLALCSEAGLSHRSNRLPGKRNFHTFCLNLSKERCLQITPDWYESLRTEQSQFLLREKQVHPCHWDGLECLPLGRQWGLPSLHLTISARNNSLGRGRIPTPLAQASSPTPLPPPNSQHVQLGTERLHLQPREAVNYFLLQETKQTLLLLFL